MPRAFIAGDDELLHFAAAANYEVRRHAHAAQLIEIRMRVVIERVEKELGDGVRREIVGRHIRCAQCGVHTPRSKSIVVAGIALLLRRARALPRRASNGPRRAMNAWFRAIAILTSMATAGSRTRRRACRRRTSKRVPATRCRCSSSCTTTSACRSASCAGALGAASVLVRDLAEPFARCAPDAPRPVRVRSRAAAS